MLNKILNNKRKEVEELKRVFPFDKLKSSISYKRQVSIFKKSLSKDRGLAIIGEIKKMSPSKGLLRADFNPIEIAKIYQKKGLDAISVLTDRRFFGGDLNYISLLKKIITIPILQKDFLIDEYQLYYSSYLKSDAMLLITSILTQKQINSFMQVAKKLKLDLLFEVHTQDDIKKALAVEADIIGINNRNLKTFNIDLKTTARLISLIPKKKNRVIISESGINTYQDVIALKKLGIDALLIGETFMVSDNISSKINEIKGRMK